MARPKAQSRGVDDHSAVDPCGEQRLCGLTDANLIVGASNHDPSRQSCLDLVQEQIVNLGQAGGDNGGKVWASFRDKIDTRHHPRSPCPRQHPCSTCLAVLQGIQDAEQVQVAQIKHPRPRLCRSLDRQVAFAQQIIAAGVVKERPTVARKGHHMGMCRHRAGCGFKPAQIGA